MPTKYLDSYSYILIWSHFLQDLSKAFYFCIYLLKIYKMFLGNSNYFFPWILYFLKYHSIVLTIPVSKFSSAFQPSSFSNFVASIAYLLSCPALSSTNVIKSLYEELSAFATCWSKIVQILSTICRFVLSFLPPILYVSPFLPLW